jgi:hypothetical protein
MPIIVSYGDGLLTSTEPTTPQPSSSIISSIFGPISSLLSTIPFSVTTGGTTISSAALTQMTCPSGQVYNSVTKTCQQIISPVIIPQPTTMPSSTIPLILFGIGGIIIVTMLIIKRRTS